MPDSIPCPARPGWPAVTGSAPPPEAGAWPQPAAAGRTGLPLSVWPAIPGPGSLAPGRDSPPCPGCPGLLAWPVISAFSRPGDLVAVTPGADCAILVIAAVSTGRRVLQITARQSGPGEPSQRSPACQIGPSPGMLPGGASAGAGRAALAVTVAGPPAGGPQAGEAAPYTDCQQALRPGGILAVIAGRPAPGQVPDLSLAVARARAAGLIYAQHIILIHARIDGGHLRPLPGLRLAAPSPPGGPPAAGIHSDLLILTKPGSPE